MMKRMLLIALSCMLYASMTHSMTPPVKQRTKKEIENFLKTTPPWTDAQIAEVRAKIDRYGTVELAAANRFRKELKEKQEAALKKAGMRGAPAAAPAVPPAGPAGRPGRPGRGPRPGGAPGDDGGPDQGPQPGGQVPALPGGTPGAVGYEQQQPEQLPAPEKTIAKSKEYSEEIKARLRSISGQLRTINDLPTNKAKQELLSKIAEDIRNAYHIFDNAPLEMSDRTEIEKSLKALNDAHTRLSLKISGEKASSTATPASSSAALVSSTAAAADEAREQARLAAYRAAEAAAAAASAAAGTPAASAASAAAAASTTVKTDAAKTKTDVASGNVGNASKDAKQMAADAAAAAAAANSAAAAAAGTKAEDPANEAAKAAAQAAAKAAEAAAAARAADEARKLQDAQADLASMKEISARNAREAQEQAREADRLAKGNPEAERLAAVARNSAKVASDQNNFVQNATSPDRAESPGITVVHENGTILPELLRRINELNDIQRKKIDEVKTRLAKIKRLLDEYPKTKDKHSSFQLMKRHIKALFELYESLPKNQQDKFRPEFEKVAVRYDAIAKEEKAETLAEALERKSKLGLPASPAMSPVGGGDKHGVAAGVSEPKYEMLKKDFQNKWPKDSPQRQFLDRLFRVGHRLSEIERHESPENNETRLQSINKNLDEARKTLPLIKENNEDYIALLRGVEQKSREVQAGMSAGTPALTPAASTAPAAAAAMPAPAATRADTVETLKAENEKLIEQIRTLDPKLRTDIWSLRLNKLPDLEAAQKLRRELQEKLEETRKTTPAAPAAAALPASASAPIASLETLKAENEKLIEQIHATDRSFKTATWNLRLISITDLHAGQKLRQELQEKLEQIRQAKKTQQPALPPEAAPVPASASAMPDVKHLSLSVPPAAASSSSGKGLATIPE